MRVQSRTISTALVMGAVCTAAFWACGPTPASGRPPGSASRSCPGPWWRTT
jgi:hypothetical protein